MVAVVEAGLVLAAAALSPAARALEWALALIRALASAAQPGGEEGGEGGAWGGGVVVRMRSACDR